MPPIHSAPSKKHSVPSTSPHRPPPGHRVSRRVTASLQAMHDKRRAKSEATGAPVSVITSVERHEALGVLSYGGVL